MFSKINPKIWAMTFLLSIGIVFSPKINTYSDDVPDSIPNLAKLGIDAKQIHCMAKNIFYEAGGESIQGQAAVARVVMNRVAHGFAKTTCAVIYQTTKVRDSTICQFSWVCEDRKEPNKNSYRYIVAQKVAYDVMVHNKYKNVVPNTVLFFHNMSVSPLWPYTEVIRIGNHIFYSKTPKQKLNPTNKNKESAS